jgi:hypothetical protein
MGIVITPHQKIEGTGSSSSHSDSKQRTIIMIARSLEPVICRAAQRNPKMIDRRNRKPGSVGIFYLYHCL